MASNANFVQYIADQCSGAGEIVTKKMFGDYGIYCDGKSKAIRFSTLEAICKTLECQPGDILEYRE